MVLKLMLLNRALASLVCTNSPGFPWVDHSLLEKLLILSHDLQPDIPKISTLGIQIFMLPQDLAWLVWIT